MHVVLGVALLLSCGQAAERVPQFTVPAGFEVVRVAAPPLVEHPTMAGFDDQGRLYVCDGPGRNEKADVLLKELPNYIRRLEDIDGDGVYDRSTIFADKMTFPMGALWHQGTVYTASPPHIWALRDTNDDGVADERRKLISEFGFTGNAADIHGCFLGPDGRVYWCDGRHGHIFVDAQGNPLSKGLAARVFSCRTDGSDLEAFAGGGMDNPVELAFAETGEPLGTVAIFSLPNRRRNDAIVHWIYGGVYPHHKCVEEFPRTGDLLPAVSDLGHVAPSGLARYRGTQLGEEYQDNLFSALFNTHTILRTRIVREGATFRSTDEPFLACDDLDVHFTDVLEDADGSLLAIDTGGWFRIGCPTSQIAKPEILGAIYRIRRKSAGKIDDPRGWQLAWDKAPAAELLPRLTDARPAVADRAMTELAARGKPAVMDVRKHAATAADPLARGRAVWTLIRIDDPDARAGVRDALGDANEAVRQIAARGAAIWRDAAALDALLPLVASSQPPAVRREAAAALGRLKQPRSVPALLEAIPTAGDRFLEHALIYALIEIDAAQPTLAGLEHPNPAVRRGALIALDQMKHGALDRAQVGRLLDTDDPALQQAALDVIRKHAGWSDETLELLGQWLADPSGSAVQAATLRGALLAFAKEPHVQQKVTDSLAAAGTPTSTRLLLLEVLGRAELPVLPDGWQRQLERHLDMSDDGVLRQAIATVAELSTDRFDPLVRRVAEDSARPEGVRLTALGVLAAHHQPIDSASFQLLVARLTADVSPVEQLSAAKALGGARLSPDQLSALLPIIESAGVLELPELVQAYAGGRPATLGGALVAALEKSPGVSSLQGPALAKLLEKYPPDIREAAAPLVKRLSVDAEAQRARLEQLAGTLEGGDAQRGRTVFFGKKAACAACHRIGAEGGAMGPELTRIGTMRKPIDLLESVVFPSASLARGFESFAVITDEGQVHNGVLARETADSVYLRTTQREEIRIDRSRIDELAPSKLSVMPQGFDQAIALEDMRDLIAYLRSLR